MIGGSDSLFMAVKEWLAWSKRHKELRVIVRSTIEAEGGEIESISIIGFLLKSPFTPINLRPVYLKATCRYVKDSGAWFICGADGKETQWVWCSDMETKEAPVERTPRVRVDNSVVALSPWLSVLLYIAFFVGVMGFIFYICVAV
jgi:hypothetical protein